VGTVDALGAAQDQDRIDDRLESFLRDWLGQWPPARPLSIVGYGDRTRPGWDGAVRDVIGVATPTAGVVSVPPSASSSIEAALAGAVWSDLAALLPQAVGRPEAYAYIGTFRWCTEPSDLAEAGTWLPVEDPRLPEWLRPFGGEALVALVDGRYASGVGLKRHTPNGVELAVGTDPAHRGRGLAARLCAQAARTLLAAGTVPTYLHDPANLASARTGAAAGFLDRGWQVLGMSPAPAA
jgi:GNAT superfamily N-acetyltransferase